MVQVSSSKLTCTTSYVSMSGPAHFARTFASSFALLLNQFCDTSSDHPTWDRTGLEKSIIDEVTTVHFIRQVGFRRLLIFGLIDLKHKKTRLGIRERDDS